MGVPGELPSKPERKNKEHAVIRGNVWDREGDGKSTMPVINSG